MNYLEILVRNAEELISQGYYRSSADSNRPKSFTESLSRCSHFPVIPEVKLSSPSRKAISSHSPCTLASEYREAGAPCVSVLTEPNYFQGSLESLASIAKMGMPVLMKDIVVSEEQVDLAAAQGSSAILLIQSIFSFPKYREKRDCLIERAHELGLEVILEVTDERELEAAFVSRSEMIGINQRNLSDLSVDKRKGRRLLPFCRDQKKPVMVMSGLEKVNEIELLRDEGASSVLVGTSLAQDERPGEKLRSMLVPR